MPISVSRLPITISQDRVDVLALRTVRKLLLQTDFSSVIDE